MEGNIAWGVEQSMLKPRNFCTGYDYTVTWVYTSDQLTGIGYYTHTHLAQSIIPSHLLILAYKLLYYHTNI